MDRPDPDAILAKIKSDESPRGKLKIFFGAVAGVGKTYTMLEAARNSSAFRGFRGSSCEKYPV